jgi:hypothetical protein
VFKSGDRDLKSASALLYGEEIRDVIPLKPLPDPIFLIHELVWKQIALRGWPDILTYPLTYPDPDGEFYGYDRLGIKLANGDFEVGTRSLVSTITLAAMVFVRMYTPHHVGSKREAIELYKIHLADEWTSLLEDVYNLCRVRWHYLLPENTADRAYLRDLCQRALGFENHVLAECRTYLLKKLRDEDDGIVLLAVQLLGQVIYADGEVENALHSLTTHNQAEIRRAVRESLKRIQQALVG